MNKLRYLQTVLNNSGEQQKNPALFQVVSEILNQETIEGTEGASDRLVAGNSQFVLDPNTGLYLENIGQSGNAQFPFRIDNTGRIFERGRTFAMGERQLYTPLFTSSGVQPTNFTTSGGYSVVGKQVIVDLLLVMSVGFTAGTGNYFLSVPPGFPMRAQTNIVTVIGVAEMFDSGTGNYAGIVTQEDGSTTAISLRFDTVAPLTGRWTAAFPVVPVAADQVGASFTYQTP